MLFNFQLAPIESIGGWGRSKHKLSLSWFGLTLGWFWIEAEGQELFRYSGELLEQWAQTHPADQNNLPYDKYQVVRYWEDLLEHLSELIDPVPLDMVRRRAFPNEWESWRMLVLGWSAGVEDDDTMDRCEQAVQWVSERTWAAWHLQHPPRFWFWTVGETLHLQWDNRGIVSDGLRVWEAEFGRVEMPVSAFIAEARSFDKRLMAAMAERVTEIKQEWSRPEIKIDLAGLEREQTERSTWFEAALIKPPQIDDWDTVRAALATIETRMAADNAQADT